jgi:uncharacterized protein involved in exopolysaccharide biosynthesis
MTELSAAPDAGLQPLEFLTAVVDRRRMIVWCMVFAVLAVIIPIAVSRLLGHRTYTSQTMVTASARRNPTSISGLAAQFGVAVPGADPTQSPAFFVDVLKSPELLGTAAGMRVLPTGNRDSVTLAEHYGVASIGAKRLEATRKRLDVNISVNSSQRSGIITLEVKDRDPEIARQIAGRLVVLLSDLNVRSRRSQAALERQFIQGQADDAARDLHSAEDDERNFLARNRNCCSSPDLDLERGRLERTVTMRQTVYTQLIQALEQARIEEVRDTPALTTIESPTTAALPDSSGVVGKMIIALFLGLMIGIVLAFLSHLLDQLKRGDPKHYAELHTRILALRRDLFRPWRLLAIGTGRGSTDPRAPE